jgi:quercetin dioxygenase-like cupin family protein
MEITSDDMIKRTARFKELSYSAQGYLDTRIPAHKRNTYNVIGRGVTEDENLKPAILEAEDFNITYIGAEPSCGAALHHHPTVEVFISMTGKWSITWGEKGEHVINIDQFDVVSVPPGIMRGFRNEGDSHNFIMAILGGSDAGNVSWAQSVIEGAEKTGLRLNEDGTITEITSS